MSTLLLLLLFVTQNEFGVVFLSLFLFYFGFLQLSECLLSSTSTGYARLRVEDEYSHLRTFADYDRRGFYLNPEDFLSKWCFSLITRVVNDITRTEGDSLHVNLKVKRHGPAVQLDIIEKTSNKVSTLQTLVKARGRFNRNLGGGGVRPTQRNPDPVQDTRDVNFATLSKRKCCNFLPCSRLDQALPYSKQ